MDITLILSVAGPVMSGLAALLGCFISSKLSTFRIEQLEEEFKKLSKHIESLIIIQGDVNNIKSEIREFKEKEDKDRGEIREDIEKLQEDVVTIKGQVGDLTVQVTKLEGEVDNVRTLVKVRYGG